MSARVEGSATERVSYLIAKRWPCESIPRGAITDIAKEIGVSRQRVKQIVDALGVETPGSGDRPRMLRLCGSCGERETGAKNGVCRDCRWVEKSCRWCGSLIRVSVSRLVSAAINGNGVVPSYNRGEFCQKVCPEGPVSFFQSMPLSQWVPIPVRGDERHFVRAVRSAAYRRGYFLETDDRDGVLFARKSNREAE